jgi:hypothetical protein
MRLLHTTTLEFREFLNRKPYKLYHDSDNENESIEEVMEYAILSHTWGNDEVLYQDMTKDREKAENKLGFPRIERSCQQAADDGYEYFWIGTYALYTCINDTFYSTKTNVPRNMLY